MIKMTYLDLLGKHAIDGAHPGGFFITRELLKSEAITCNTRLLDIGCGTGQTSAYIAKKYGCNVVAADIRADMLQNAAKRFSRENLRVSLIFADAMKLPFLPCQFDIVLAESVTIFTTMYRSLKEYNRVLKPGGILIDIELTAEYPFLEKELSEIRPVLGVEHVPVQEEWYELLYNAGFKRIQSCRGIMLPHQGALPLAAISDFNPYFCLMNKYASKLGYRIFRCEK